MQVIELDGRGNKDGICKYRNLTVKITVKTGMPEGLINKRCRTIFLFFINAWPSAAAQRTAMYSGRSVVGEASLIVATSITCCTS